MSGWNPPPGGPVRPAGPPPPGGPSPGPPHGPPRSGTGTGKVIGCLAGVAVAALFLLGGGGYFVYLSRTSHTLSTPPSAGGLSRDFAAEPTVNETVRKLRTVLIQASGYKVTGRVSAVYGTGEEKYLFVGGTGKHDAKYPERFLNTAVARTFTGSKGVSSTPSTVKITDAGGDGIALSTSIRISLYTPSGPRTLTAHLATWSTRTTMGIVMEVGASRSAALPSVMRRIRADVED